MYFMEDEKVKGAEVKGEKALKDLCYSLRAMD